MTETTAPAAFEFQTEFQALTSDLPAWPAAVIRVFNEAFQASPGQISMHWAMVLGLMLLVGLAAERAGCWKVNLISAGFQREHTDSLSARTGFALMNVVLDLVGVAIFAAVAYLVRHITVDSDAPVFATLGLALTAILKVRCIAVVARAIFAPHAEGIRPLPLSTDDARAFFAWMVAFSATYASASFLGEMLVSNSIESLYARASAAIVGGLVAAAFAIFLFANRERIRRLFASDNAPAAGEAASGGAIGKTLAQLWPLLAALWLVVLWVNWSHAIFTGNKAREGSLEIAWWVTLLFPLADRLFHAGLKALLEMRFVANSPFAARRARFRSVLQAGFRLLLLAVSLFALAVAWRLAGASMLSSGIGRQVLAGIIDIGTTLLLAYVLWEVVISVLDHYMPKKLDGAEESPDGEGGGAGATRAETLAPLLRGTFIIVLLVVVVLTVLSSLGVEVTPLLAGAGVFGIALGFGAQKLVQDVISGLFFLLDDAFRRGEYIDVGTVKGTVERISIRSLQLRHHMGNLHTIPFGEIRYLTNFSRDWVMMKLKLRLVYGTDPEKVRKVVKKLGQELLEDPEVGPMFMEPLKSQGVFSMEDDSAMIFRVKFMTRPGDQFVARKAVYNAINRRFEEQNIHFAHRVVTVRVEDEGNLLPDEKTRQRVAAAAMPPESGPAPAGADAR